MSFTSFVFKASPRIIESIRLSLIRKLIAFSSRQPHHDAA